MPRLFTPPDFDFDKNRPRVLIRNCPWSDIELQKIVESLSDAAYDIYIYNDSMRDVQWLEGVRTHSIKNLNYNEFKHLDPIEWLRTLDDVVR